MANQLDLVARYYFRYLIQLPSIYRPSGKPHIFIFSTRRSGSTLLRDMVSSQNGINYIDQPFDFTENQFNPYRHHFPTQYKKGQIVTASKSEQTAMREYLDGMLGRRYIVRSQWRFWDKSYHWRWDRYVVKELSTKALLPWFETIWGDRIRIVYLVRHPMATVHSVSEQTWDHTYQIFLDNPEFMETQLSGKMRRVGRAIAASGSPVEKHMLDWCLENLTPLRLWKSHHWTTISYEKIVEAPAATARRLCTELDLHEPDKMISTVAIPSRSATRQAREVIKQSGPPARLSAWMKAYDRETLAQAARVLQAFEVDLYDMEHPYALEQFDA